MPKVLSINTKGHASSTRNYKHSFTYSSNFQIFLFGNITSAQNISRYVLRVTGQLSKHFIFPSLDHPAVHHSQGTVASLSKLGVVCD